MFVGTLHRNCKFTVCLLGWFKTIQKTMIKPSHTIPFCIVRLRFPSPFLSLCFFFSLVHFLFLCHFLSLLRSLLARYPFSVLLFTKNTSKMKIFSPLANNCILHGLAPFPSKMPVNSQFVYWNIRDRW